jgi:hypothetical protein
VDCDDADGARWLAMEGWADSDGDGAGAGAALSFCTGGALPAGHAAVGGDCAPADRLAWRTFVYAFRDGDGDERTVAAAGELCVGASPPAGFLASGSGADCDDANAAVWEVRSGYADVDRDGVGAGALEPVCSGAALPAGWVAQAGDCAPDDALAWRRWDYTHRDADGDGRTVAEAGTLCVGAATPDGYASAARGADCDDGDPSVWATTGGFADVDRDGAGAGALTLFCTDGTLPAGYVATGADCAPSDAAAWRLLAYSLADADGDGRTAAVPKGEVCAGDALPDPWRASPNGNDCDDGDPLTWRAIVRYPDQDGDGVGATPRAVFCVGAEEPSAHSQFGWDVDDGDPAVTWDDADEELLLTLF